MSVLLVPGAKWLPVTNFSAGTSGKMIGHLGLVLHVQVGNGSLHGWFSNPKASASSHWWVAKDGTIEQYVDPLQRAWAQMAGNSTYNSVETEGYPNEPLTAAQLKSLAVIYAWGHKQFGWPNALAEAPGQKGFAWHGMGGVPWGNHPGCPGDLRKPQRADVLHLAFPPAPQPAPKPVPVVDKRYTMLVFALGDDQHTAGLFARSAVVTSNLADARGAIASGTEDVLVIGGPAVDALGINAPAKDAVQLLGPRLKVANGATYGDSARLAASVLEVAW